MLSNKRILGGFKMSKLGDFKYKLQLKYWLFRNRYELSHNAWKPDIMTLTETMEYINQNNVSIIRFGDGEWKWMLNLPQDSFQKNDDVLTKRLNEIIKDDDSKILICISDAFSDLTKYKPKVQEFWSSVMCSERKKLKSIFIPGYRFGNLNITRFYIDYKNTDHVEFVLDSWRNIWNDRDIVIVEGEYTRLGIGNDLFSGTKSINRIIAPSKNAYDVYDSLFSFIKENVDKSKLILIALGPTATVLAYDLAKIGYRAIDVGHIDIEYEWFIRKSKSKIAIPFKYVNEAANNRGRNVSEILDLETKSKYEKEIIRKISNPK